MKSSTSRPPAADLRSRGLLLLMWALALISIVAVRSAYPPIRGLSRRLEFDELVSIVILLAALPLAAIGVVAAVAHACWRSPATWWAYHWSLALMGASLMFTIAYADWQPICRVGMGARGTLRGFPGMRVGDVGV